MDIRYMEKLEKKLTRFEEDIFEGRDIDIKEFYKLKKTIITTKTTQITFTRFTYDIRNNVRPKT